MEYFSNFTNIFLNIFENGVFGLSIFQLFLIVSSLVISLILREIFAKILINRIKSIVKISNNKIDDSLYETLAPPIKLLPFTFVLFVFTLFFEADSTLGNYLKKINITFSTIIIFWFAHQALIPFSIIFHKLEKLLNQALVRWIINALKYLIIFLGFVAVLEVWGIKIGPVIAGLGLFGVAVALGAQDLFKNLISGIMILLEKRFHIGDVINVPGHTEGSVEHIGFRSTLIRKFDSTPITIPNYIFAEAPILNYSNRTNRRINWVIGLEYSSTLEQIKSFTEIISNYIKNSSDFLVNDNFKSFVRLDKFNDSSVDILIYCFTSTNDWEEFLKIKENLALKIKEEVERAGLGFAFPSQSVYIEKIKKEDIS